MVRTFGFIVRLAAPRTRTSSGYKEGCGATLLAFAEELSPFRRRASKSEGRKNQRLPSRHPGICPDRAMRFTVLGCSRRKRAASVQFQTGSMVFVVFIGMPVRRGRILRPPNDVSIGWIERMPARLAGHTVCAKRKGPIACQDGI